MADAPGARAPAQNLPLVLALGCALLALATLFVIALRGGLAPSTSPAPSATPAAPSALTVAPSRRAEARAHATASPPPAVPSEPEAVSPEPALPPGDEPPEGLPPGNEALTALQGRSDVMVLQSRGDRALLRWSDPDGQVWTGWIVVRKGDPLKVKATPGRGRVVGVVRFDGVAPVMKVPKKLEDAEGCKAKNVPYDAVIAKDGRLAGVLVRIRTGGVTGAYPVPKEPALLAQRGCMYTPRIQGAMVGQQLLIQNEDTTLHNVHSFRGAETWRNMAQPKGSPPLEANLLDARIIKFTCDVHPWMHGFVVVTDHPFFTVTGEDGRFEIERVPPGKYTLEAWHPHYGLKTASIRVDEGGLAATATFAYDGSEPEPDENKDELKDLF